MKQNSNFNAGLLNIPGDITIIVSITRNCQGGKA